MGCGASKATPATAASGAVDLQCSVAPFGSPSAPVAQSAGPGETAAVEKMAAQKAPAGPGEAAQPAVDFPILTPMLVMPFAQFKQQGCIAKSTAAWREQRLMVEYRDGLVVVFVSQRWWHSPPGRPDGVYDWGGPDFMEGENVNLKWRLICQGVEALIERDGLAADDVAVWIDWQSIHQDEHETKAKGVVSLIKYATLCSYMLVPINQVELKGNAKTYPENIPNYGERGWCRCEYFIFSLFAEMQPAAQDVQLFAVLNDGRLHQYPKVKVLGERFMPSGGKLTNPADKESIRKLEDTMIESYGSAIVRRACAAGTNVDLRGKMLRDVHVSVLCEAVGAHAVTSLDLGSNRLSGNALAGAVRAMGSLAALELQRNNIGNEGCRALAAAVAASGSLAALNLARNKIGPDGVKAIADAVAASGSLTELSLLGNQIGDEGAKALADGVAASGSLAQLDIGRNKIGVECAKHLAEAISASGSLAELNIGWNNIGVEGAKHLAEAIRASGSLALKTLWVGFSHEGLRVACQAKGVSLHHV